MSLMYWDTSALLKIYVPETDSDLFLDLIGKAEQPIYTSVIGEVEIECALICKERSGEIARAGAARAMNRFIKDCVEARIIRIPCGDEMTSKARAIVKSARTARRPVMIRSLDAIHVASALSLRASGIVATDIRMREVAVMAGLKVFPSPVQ